MHVIDTRLVLFELGFLFAFCIIVCVLYFCLRFVFLLALCFFVCVLYFSACVVLFCVRFFCLAMCSFLFEFSLFLWWCVLFCLRFLFLFVLAPLVHRSTFSAWTWNQMGKYFSTLLGGVKLVLGKGPWVRARCVRELCRRFQSDFKTALFYFP